jgi:hypothetical protein
MLEKYGSVGLLAFALFMHHLVNMWSNVALSSALAPDYASYLSALTGTIAL